MAHPFREGNGRSTRIWLDCLLKKELGQVIDWRLVDQEDYLLAMEHSPGRDREIKALLKQALTDQIHDPEVYRKRIDQSYYYEGYHILRCRRSIPTGDNLKTAKRSRQQVCPIRMV